MKILQTRFLIILGIFMLPFFDGSSLVSAAPDNKGITDELGKADLSAVALAKADSAFRLKQYTQSFELYDSLFHKNTYSAAMLIKMAYIQEGLGHVGLSLYYLNLYYIASSDNQAITKIQEVAAKNNLEGYEVAPGNTVYDVLVQNKTIIAGAVAAVCVLLLSIMFYQKFRRHQKPVVAFVFLVALLAGLFGFTFYTSSSGQGIVAYPSTYLMSGPSAGASVVSIIDEGHRLEILGEKDVWTKVKWLSGEAYVKRDGLLRIQL